MRGVSKRNAWLVIDLKVHALTTQSLRGGLRARSLLTGHIWTPPHRQAFDGSTEAARTYPARGLPLVVSSAVMQRDAPISGNKKSDYYL